MSAEEKSPFEKAAKETGLELHHAEPIDERIKPNDPNYPLLWKDIWNAILDDSWMYPVVWGQPRTGKTTVQLKTAFEVYHDWDQALQAFVFNLSGVLYKMKKGEPCRITTRNLLHQRVPLLIGDDWAAQNNKAATQHMPCWDLFKGAFDTLGTKMAVFMVSMNNPSGITDQLQQKYTHEIYIDQRGVAKYDTVEWRQNYIGWQAKQNKDWRQTFKFTPAPKDVYKQYDEMRLGLVDDLFQQIDDAMIENEGLRVFRRLNEDDINFIEMIQSSGRISNEWLNRPENDKWKEVFKRAKARSLVVPMRVGTAYWYDLTDFGFNIYQLIQVKKEKGELPICRSSDMQTEEDKAENKK
jgi:hypothetical protein